jgi:hypothetical protein
VLRPINRIWILYSRQLACARAASCPLREVARSTCGHAPPTQGRATIEPVADRNDQRVQALVNSWRISGSLLRGTNERHHVSDPAARVRAFASSPRRSLHHSCPSGGLRTRSGSVVALVRCERGGLNEAADLTCAFPRPFLHAAVMHSFPQDSRNGSRPGRESALRAAGADKFLCLSFATLGGSVSQTVQFRFHNHAIPRQSPRPGNSRGHS